MNFVPIANEQAASALRRCPLVAVDLGFSGRSRTTGVAWSLPSRSEAKKHWFGEAAAVVAAQFWSLGEAALVLEAPLSAAFDKSGNPRARGGFEREPQPHWWSFGPGAATALSALFFLRLLESELKAVKVKVHLIEGFVSGDAFGDHAEVAAALRDGFQGKRKCLWHSVTGEGSVVSALDWLGCESPHSPPVILQPVVR